MPFTHLKESLTLLANNIDDFLQKATITSNDSQVVDTSRSLSTVVQDKSLAGNQESKAKSWSSKNSCPTSSQRHFVASAVPSSSRAVRFLTPESTHLLQNLSAQPITVNLLRETRIGDKLNKLVKFKKAGDNVVDRGPLSCGFNEAEMRLFETCASLVKKWKQHVETQKQSQKEVNSRGESTSSNSSISKSSSNDSTSSAPARPVPIIEQPQFLVLYEATETWQQLHATLSESIESNSQKIRAQVRSRMQQFHKSRSEVVVVKPNIGKLGRPNSSTSSSSTSVAKSVPPPTAGKRKYSLLVADNKPKISNLAIIKAKLGMK
jgi:hypothetical protein